ncbi:TauD/TfdA family dioxygenase [Paenibacillus larvae]|nr:TauD/TfdA family dioxygenase [Paenibacillus larvae]PCK71084.1 hypothetical protein PL1_1301 [Paenibacillus larvae subsp. larvae B-3650]AQR78130.1 hypothetical protein BXP28_13145 [Paenibacillus larvae subsp. larvae]MCY7477347.1 TauD/TfdA family dioxygenase [Paenibacillus larvae]MCY7488383.1 TauD/TfdA family dioxygenase [Paenibacillus larvae]MCY9564672.1 TauD/TfdA family dioxygenase [Paenibacillus larvae]
MLEGNENQKAIRPEFQKDDRAKGKGIGNMTAVARQLAEKAFGVKISDIQREALDLFDSITFNPDFQLVMKLEPGDMQFLNNHVVIHSRTEFEDYEDPKLKKTFITVMAFCT